MSEVATAWAADGLRDLASRWHADPDRPRVDDGTLRHWDELLDWWVGESRIPLPMRKKFPAGYGTTRRAGARTFVSVDNSPAQWLFARLTMAPDAPWRPDRAELEVAVREEMPVAMVLSKAQRDRATFTRRLQEGPSTSAVGYQLHHIDKVVGSQAKFDRLGQTDRLGAVRRFLSPRNMFVLPKSLAGLGEIGVFIEAFRTEAPSPT